MSAKKKKHEEHENHERWLVSYADFITLLFAFFVVMYATSTNNTEKQKQFEESVRKELKLTVVSTGQGGSGESGAMVPELINPVDSFPRRGGPAEVSDYVDRQIGKSMSKEERNKYVQEVRYDGLGARISLASASFFPPASTKLKKSALESLNKLAELLKTTNRRILIEGHTDDEPISSEEFTSNWELAALRATSVVRYLVKYQGVDPKRLGAISYGEQRPLAPNDTPENRAKNRRIEILITSEQEE